MVLDRILFPDALPIPHPQPEVILASQHLLNPRVTVQCAGTSMPWVNVPQSDANAHTHAEFAVGHTQPRCAAEGPNLSAHYDRLNLSVNFLDILTNILSGSCY